MDSMDEALMMVGKAPGGAFTAKAMKRYQEERLIKLTRRLPRNLSKKKLAQWLMDHSSEIIELIKYGDES